MILGHSIPEVKKAVVSFVFLLGAILAMVLTGYNPSFTQAVVGLVGAVFAVVAVFMSKNHTVDDLSKAVAQLQGAAVFVVGYFTTVPTGTVQKIAVIAGAIVSVYAVFAARNTQPVSAPPVPDPTVPAAPAQ